MFIVIDWLDWSGKATQVNLIEKKLKEMWKTVKVLDYPRYWEKSAFGVEKYLNWEYWEKLSAKKASILYAIDRFDDSFSVKKDLEKYDYIISNRYTTANMIHQTGKMKTKEEREDFLNWISDLEYNILEIPIPDKVIFLNVTPELSQKMVLKKDLREYLKWGKKMDLHEADKNHLINAWKAAIEAIEKYSWIKIDCVKDWKMRLIEDINKEILSNII